MTPVVFGGFSLFFLLLLLPLPHNRSIIGSTDTLLGVGLSNGYLNAIKARLTGEPVGRAMYPAQPARFGEAALGAASIFILYRAFGLDDVWALYLFQATLLTLMAFATFLVAREYLGRAPPAVFVAVVFTTSNFLWSNIDDLPIHFYFFPLLSLYFLKRAIATGRNADAWKVALLGGLQACFSFQVFAYQTILLGIVAACNLGALRRHFTWARIGATSGAYLLLALPVLAFYLMSAWRLQALDMWTDAGSLALYRLNLTDLVTQLPHKFITYPFVNVLEPPPHVIEAWNWGLVRDSAFIGLLVPVLAVVGLTSRPRATTELLIIAFAGLFLALGRTIEVGDHRFTSPLQFLYDVVPLLSYVRVTLRSFSLTILAVSILAGFGLLRLTTRWARRSLVLGASSAAAALIAIGENLSWPLNPGEIIRYPEVSSGYVEFFKDKPDAVILDLPSTSTSWPGYVDEATYLLWQTKHRRSILGGVNGYYPPSRLKTQAHTDSLPSNSTLAYFRSAGVTHFVVHDSPYLRQQHEPTSFAPSLAPGQVKMPAVGAFTWLDASPDAELSFRDDRVRIYRLIQPTGPGIASISQEERHQRIRAALDKALAYLGSARAPDGGFPNWLCFDRQMRQCIGETNLFVPAMIAHSLVAAKDVVGAESVRPLLERTLGQLTAGRIPSSSLWPYSSVAVPGIGPYPPDIDDTACAAAALTQHGVQFPENVPQLLQRQSPSGSFPTWLSGNGVSGAQFGAVLRQANFPALVVDSLEKSRHWDPAEPHDCAMNANLLFYLSLRGQAPASLCRYVSDVVSSGAYPRCSLYYENDLVFAYFVTRAYAEGRALCLLPAVRLLIDRLINRTTSSPQEMALKAIALMNGGVCGQQVAGEIDSLVSTQNPDGSWPRDSFYLLTGKLGYFGSEVLATAAAVEALAKALLKCPT